MLASFVSHFLLAFSPSEHSKTMVVVFGRPGAGKTTVANAALERIQSHSSTTQVVLGLDLDVCVPQWMKDNFAKGIYPTLSQRQEFARDACRYVENEISSSPCIISFSFVNTDMRDIFRERFPHATWMLVDIDDAEAAERIRMRKDHFYKGKMDDELKNEEEIEEKAARSQPDVDKSEWDFAPVTYPHTVLNGNDSIDVNAKKVADFLLQAMRENHQP